MIEKKKEKEKEKKQIMLKKIRNKPVLYRNFPLIGSDEFNMPFIVDGFDFYPLESRSGILLNGGRNTKKKKLKII